MNFSRSHVASSYVTLLCIGVVMSNEIMFRLYVFALSFQKSSLITLSLIMITCYHDNSLTGPIAHFSIRLSPSLAPLLLFIVFVVTPPHPSAPAITHFNLSSEDSICSLLQNLFIFLAFLVFWFFCCCCYSQT